ncbi:MAG: tetratricopeptide repeat protein [Microscillaceae bacterium]|jgi:tetratricopeptide (TPR) repeat protein|nr:tetratricopeptide repeat protein [Microscillaceae bacterium]
MKKNVFLSLLFYAYAYWSFAQSDKELVKQGDMAFNQQNYPNAIRLYDRALLMNPNNEIAYNNRGWTNYLLGNRKEAIIDLQKAVSLDSTYAAALKNLAHIQLENKEIDTGLRNIDKAIPQLGNDSYAFLLRGRFYLEKRALAEARADFDRTIQLDNKTPDAFFYRGYTLMNLKEYELAVNDFSRLIQLSPKFAPAYNNRGFCYLSMGKTEEALRDFDMALLFNPKDASALVNRGVIHKNKGLLDKACADWKKAMDLGKEDGKIFYEENCIKSAPISTTQINLENTPIKDKATIETALTATIKATGLKPRTSLKLCVLKGKEETPQTINNKTLGTANFVWFAAVSGNLNASLSNLITKPGIYDAYLEYVDNQGIPKVINFRIRIKK